MRAWGPLLALGLLPASSSASGPKISVEKATIAWSELQRLVEADGDGRPIAPTPTPPPHAYAATAEIQGQVEGGGVTLSMELTVDVLDERWILVPVLPQQMSVASAQVQAPLGRRGLLVRERAGVLFAADGPGRYQVSLEAEGTLEHTPRGRELTIPLQGLTGGHAQFLLGPGVTPGGRTAWRTSTSPGGLTEASSALGAGGLDLVVGDAEAPVEADGSLDNLAALTVLSLGGSGVTRLSFHATPSATGDLEVTLPRGARLWKAFVGERALDPARLGTGEHLKVALKGPSQVELAYTFGFKPFGLRGHYRVELPRLGVPVRDATWQLWLPAGLQYGETQAALGALPGCDVALPRARTLLQGQGECREFARPVLEPGAAYVEGAYAQPL